MSTQSQYPRLNDREWLRERYFADRWTIKQVAEEIGCERGAVVRALRRFGWEPERRFPAEVAFDENELRTLLREGHSVADIARAKGCVPQTVRRALGQFGISPPGRRRSSGRDLSYEFLHHHYVEKQRSAAEIAEEVGCTRNAVYRRLAALGISRRIRTSSFTDAVAQRARALYDSGMSTTQVAKELGMSVGGVATCVERAGGSLRSSSEGLRVRYPEGRRGPLASNWRGGSRQAKSGYVWLHRDVVRERWPNHPRLALDDWDRCQEHRLVMEDYLGRLLEPTELVDHGPGGRADNRIENLTLKSSRAEHTADHWRDAMEAARLRERVAQREADLAQRDERIAELERQLQHH